MARLCLLVFVLLAVFSNAHSASLRKNAIQNSPGQVGKSFDN